MANQKRVILLSRVSTYRSRPFVEAAKRLGIEVVHGVDMDPNLVDYWQIPLDIQFDKPDKAVAQILAFAQKKPVKAVISVDDSASIIAARANEALGLRIFGLWLLGFLGLSGFWVSLLLVRPKWLSPYQELTLLRINRNAHQSSWALSGRTWCHQ